MKNIVTPQSVFWNKKEIVEEFAAYEAPKYWKEFLSTFKNPDSIRVLDLGCGGGRNSVLAAGMGFHVSASDLHFNMVKATRKVLAPYIPKAELVKRVVKTGFEKTPYATGAFDVVIASGVLHNANTVKKFRDGVHEISRILKNNGSFCMNIFYLESDDPTMRASKREKGVFYTDIGLPMVLLGRKEIISELAKAGIVPTNNVTSYESQVNTGRRYVLRGVFRKEPKW